MIVQFEKTPRVKFIGHLDMQRCMQRALRRGGLPVAYSQGFNPHMLISFASPLPVGASGTEELLDVALAEPCTEQAFADALSAALPPELPLRAVRAVEDKHPKLMARLRTAAYRLTLEEGEAAQAMRRAIPDFLAQASLPAIRISKKGETPCDIRPMIHELREEPEGLYARVAFTEAETLKPDLLVRTLATFAKVEPPKMELCRLRLYGEKDGVATPLMDC